MHIDGSLNIAPTWFSFVAFFLRLGVSTRKSFGVTPRVGTVFRTPVLKLSTGKVSIDEFLHFR